MFHEDFVQKNRVFPVGEPERDDRLFQYAKAPAFELGGDITRPLGGGAIKLVGLLNRRDQENLDTVLEQIDDVVVGGFEQSPGSSARRDARPGKLEPLELSRAEFRDGRRGGIQHPRRGPKPVPAWGERLPPANRPSNRSGYGREKRPNFM